MTQFVPGEPASIAAGEFPATDVHVWLADLDGLDQTRMQQLAQTLAPEERVRAARFYRERDRQRFTAARGLLRTLLGEYLHCLPRDIQFSYGQRGKPALHAPFDHEQLRFNVSHSRGLALYAVTRGREIGIDIEYMRELNDAEAIAERFFSERERAALRSLHPAQRHRGFFTCWCRKEAYIKAIGEGLAMPLDQFDVSLLPDEPARLLHAAHDAAEATRWSLMELVPAVDYMGAVAAEGHDWHLRCWRWSD